MTTTLKTTPMYLAFVTALQARTTCPSREISGYVCFEHPTSGHKLYVDKSVKGLKPVHTTLAIDPTTPGWLPALPGTGKCVNRMPADLETVVTILESLGEGKLRPANRAKTVTQAPVVPTYSEQEFAEEAKMYQNVTH